MPKALPSPLTPPSPALPSVLPPSHSQSPYSLLLNLFLVDKFMSSSFTALPFDLEEGKKNLSIKLLNVFFSQTPVLYVRSIAFHDY